MKCNLYNPNRDLNAVWLSWKKVEQFWHNNNFHPLNSTNLKPAFHDLWFEFTGNGLPLFKIGAICYDETKNSILFYNGRHRTIILTTFTNEIPISIDESISKNRIFENAIVKPIGPDDVIELPDYPIKKCKELRG
jgi:hypothetical protein